MPAFGNTSKKRLMTCDSRIQLICNEAIEIIDFSIITGHRTEEEQNALYPKYTKVKWPNGKHNSFPSMAVDIAPYISPYGVLFGGQKQLMEIQDYLEAQGTPKSFARINSMIDKAYARLLGHIEVVAHVNDIGIRLGLDWDGDYNLLDQTFHDLGHWELE